ncbi:MAG: glycosyltransferase family 9 protein [Candidatus Omnitrophota bacterium]
MSYIFKNRACVFFIFLFDLIGGLIFLPFVIFRKKRPGNVANILVIRLDDTSNVIFSTVAASNLKAHYKGAKVTILTSSFARDVVIDNPIIDEIICYDAPWFCKRTGAGFSLSGFLKLANELKGHSYDLGIDLKGDIRHIFLMALAGVRFRVGYGITGGGFLLHRAAGYNPCAHDIERGLCLLKEIPVGITDDRPRLYVSEASQAAAGRILADAEIRDGDFLTVMHTVADCESKSWFDRKFAALAGVIRRQYDVRIILIGDEGDKRRNDEIARLSGADIVNACGKGSFQIMAALIKRSSLFIGIDGLPGRLAALQGVPSVILCSSAWSGDEWSGIGERVIRMRKDISCKGCGISDCAQNICMDLISVDDVVESVKDILGVKRDTVQGPDSLTLNYEAAKQVR